MDNRPTPNSFGTFLETLHEREAQDQRLAGTPLKLLDRLVSGGELHAAELLAESGAGVAEFSQAIITMRDAGLVAIGGPAGQETVQLTPAGEQLAKLL